MQPLVVLLLASLQGPAERARANELLQAGNAALRAGEYDRAVQNYEAAYEIFPSPKLLYNLGKAYQMAGRLPEEAEVFERFINQVARSERELQNELSDRVSRAQTELQLLDPDLAVVAVRVRPADATLSVDGRARLGMEESRALRLSPGKHQLVASKDGFLPERRSVSVAATQRIALEIDLAAANDARPLQANPLLSDAVPVVRLDAASKPRWNANWWTLALIGGAVLASAATVAIIASRGHSSCAADLGCY